MSGWMSGHATADVGRMNEYNLVLIYTYMDFIIVEIFLKYYLPVRFSVAVPEIIITIRLDMFF